MSQLRKSSIDTPPVPTTKDLCGWNAFTKAGSPVLIRSTSVRGLHGVVVHLMFGDGCPLPSVIIDMLLQSSK